MIDTEQDKAAQPEGRNEAPPPEGRNKRKVREGYVVSDKMDKTVVVALEDRKKHALYGKVLRSTTKVKAHDEANVAGVGDRVLLMETRPLSATKRWRLVQILEKAK
ncbi:MAG: 30S ribosomal protein S17 [Pseudonocardiaceae bacterium]